MVAVVNQRPGGRRIAAQNLRRWVAGFGFTIHPHLLAGQVLGRATATATATGKKFNQHRLAPAYGGGANGRPV